jgi:hypothetical protein
LHDGKVWEQTSKDFGVRTPFRIMKQGRCCHSRPRGSMSQQTRLQIARVSDETEDPLRTEFARELACTESVVRFRGYVGFCLIFWWGGKICYHHATFQGIQFDRLGSRLKNTH